MAIQDHIGRIHRTAFVVSIGFFLGLALIAVVFRFVVRFAVQKQRFQIDDALIILAAALNVATTVVLYDRVVEFMYLIEAIQYEIPGVQPPSNIVSLAETFQIALMVCWTSISTVKVFFLLFFWRLIDRLRSWKIYWWFVLILNVLIIIFGMTVYWISCPYWGRKALSCANGSGQNPLVRYSAAQISLDILGDVLILVIPIGLLWKVHMTFVQKLALSTSLCLTIILIALSITRASGLVWKGKMDYVWEFYWIIMSANVGVILASASAFRAFFVAQKNNKTSPYPPIRTPDDNSGTSSKRRLTLRTRERTFRPIEDSFFEIDMTRNTRSHERVESVTLNDMGCDSQRYIRRNDIAYPRAVVVGEQV